MDPVGRLGNTDSNVQCSYAQVALGDDLQIYDDVKSCCTVVTDQFQACPDFGTLIFNFSAAVTDGIIHVANLCAYHEQPAYAKNGGSSMVFNLDAANSTFTSGSMTLSKASGAPGLMLDCSRVEAPEELTTAYDLNKCGYVSVIVICTYIKVTVKVDMD